MSNMTTMTAANAAGVEGDGLVRLEDAERRRARFHEARGERRSLVELSRLRDLQSQEIGTQDVDAKFLVSDAEHDAVRGLLHEDHVAKRTEPRRFHAFDVCPAR